MFHATLDPSLINAAASVPLIRSPLPPPRPPTPCVHGLAQPRPEGSPASPTPLSPASPVLPQLYLLGATPGLLCLGIWPPRPEPQGLFHPGSIPHLWTPPALQAEPQPQQLSVFSLPVLRAFARAAPLASTYYPRVTSQNFPGPAGWETPPRWFSSSSPALSCRGFL